jgi:hypothetical protein
VIRENKTKLPFDQKYSTRRKIACNQVLGYIVPFNLGSELIEKRFCRQAGSKKTCKAKQGIDWRPVPTGFHLGALL